jgi:predicted RNase H-like nuclease (RuvC/YqgF family)
VLESELNEQEQNLRIYQTKYESLIVFNDDFEETNRKKIEVLNQKIIKNSALQNELAEEQKKQNFLEKDLQTAEENARSSVDGMCPFLHSKCKNINEGSLSSYFEDLRILFT